MKICHVITRMIIGGAQENTLYTCQGLIEAGHEVTLITGKTVGPEGNLLEQTNVPNLRIIEIPHLIRELSLKHDLLAFIELKKVFEKEKFDIVHTHSSKAGFIGRIAAKTAHIPFIFHTIHGLSFHPYQSTFKNCLFILAEKIGSKCSQHIFAVAQAMINQSLTAGIGYPEQYSVNYSGMEIEKFINAKRDVTMRERLHIPTNAIVIGTLARLFDFKGYEFLIKAAPEVIKRNPNIHFLIVGDGINRERYQNEIQRLEISNHFSFAGLIQPKEIPSYIAQMDLLAHFSLHEGLPRAAVQALANGKPVVAFPLDGTPEVVINNHHGLLCKTESIPSITEALITLANDEEKRQKFGCNGQTFVKELFDWHYMVKDIEAKYKHIYYQKETIQGI